MWHVTRHIREDFEKRWWRDEITRIRIRIVRWRGHFTTAMSIVVQSWVANAKCIELSRRIYAADIFLTWNKQEIDVTVFKNKERTLTTCEESVIFFRHVAHVNNIAYDNICLMYQVGITSPFRTSQSMYKQDPYRFRSQHLFTKRWGICQISEWYDYAYALWCCFETLRRMLVKSLTAGK